LDLALRNFHYSDHPPRYGVGAIALGNDGAAGAKPLCPKAQSVATESLEGVFPGGDPDSPGSLYIEIYPFKTAATAHREFKCLRNIKWRLSGRHGDLTDLYNNSAGDERMGGAGDETRWPSFAAGATSSTSKSKTATGRSVR
jgi:hypothetical protein